MAAACGSSAPPNGPPTPVIAATTTIWADVVSNLMCVGEADVVSIVPTGADAHSFEPSLADRDRLDEASLVVANGLGFEEGLERTLDDIARSGKAVYTIAGSIDPIGDDPHFWLDPALVSAALPELTDALTAALELTPGDLDACLANYQSRLDGLDAEITELLSNVSASDRRIVTNHDSLGYFAQRYDLEVAGTVLPSSSTLAQPNPADLAALGDLIEESGIDTIFVEAAEPSRDAEALAARLDDVSVVELHIGGLTGPDGDAGTYEALLRHDAELIAAALG